MNASQFMDKQIMELSASGAQGGDLLELLSPPDNHQSNGAGAGGGGKMEEILPSYDFQPIRTVGSSPPSSHSSLDGGGRARGSVDAKSGASGFRARNYSSLEAQDSSKIIHEKSREACDTTTLAEFDRTVKKYVDNLLHALEGVSSRLSQLEGRTHTLESAVDDLKLSIANNNGSTDGKLRHLENILREIQTGMQVLRDKQEIAEAQMQLAKLQAPKGDPQPQDNSIISTSETKQQPVPPSHQHLQPPAQPSMAPPLPPQTQLPALPMPPAPNAPPPPPPPQQNPPPPPVQFPSHVPQAQVPSIPSMLPREPYFPSPGQPVAEASQQQYQPPHQQPQLPPPQQYQPPPQVPPPQLPHYSQPPPSSQPIHPPQPQASLSHHPEESSPYMPPPQTYPPGIRQPPQLPTGPLPSQQFYGSSANMYEPPKIRPSSGQQPFSTGYGPLSGPSFSDPYPYSGSPSHHSSGAKPSPFSSSTPRLPTAQILPKAVPSESSSSGASGNRVPIDDVVDKVATMGFPRDLVRATVRRLTENGQNVDLNVVLDKMMNDSENQPQKAWFSR